MAPDDRLRQLSAAELKLQAGDPITRAFNPPAKYSFSFRHLVGATSYTARAWSGPYLALTLRWDSAPRPDELHSPSAATVEDRLDTGAKGQQEACGATTGATIVSPETILLAATAVSTSYITLI